ncbi:MAG: phosphoglycerate kinase [Bacteroidia bacterium]
MRTLHEGTFEGKRVLVRVDFNVPLRGGKVQDDRRIRAALPTLQYLLDRKPRYVLLLSHLGRPKEGKKEADLSLLPVKTHLETLLGQPISFYSSPEEVLVHPPSTPVALLENIRFFPGETKGDPAFAQILASMGDVYVNDAFGSAHRAHASTTMVANFIPHKYAGFLLEAEIRHARKVLENIQAPYCVIVGGAKVSDKLPILENLLSKLDILIIGGGMSYTFLKAQGFPIGKSLCDTERLPWAKEFLMRASRLGKSVLLPVDSLGAKAFTEEAIVSHYDSKNFPEDLMGVDIGPKTLDAIREPILRARTILWNGPMGVFEWEKAAEGTAQVAAYVAQATQSGAYSLIGGGDTAAAIEKYADPQKFSYISTGGGALLEFLEGKVLPGIAALEV